MHICVWVCEHGCYSHRSWKRASDSLEAEVIGCELISVYSGTYTLVLYKSSVCSQPLSPFSSQFCTKTAAWWCCLCGHSKNKNNLLKCYIILQNILWPSSSGTCFNSSTLETKSGESPWVQGKPGLQELGSCEAPKLHRIPISKNKTKKCPLILNYF